MMMTEAPNKPLFTIAIAVVLASLALAGCADTGGGGGSGATFDSYDDAKSAPGFTLAPNGSDSSARIKVLTPSQQSGLEEDEQEIVILVYDSDTDEPITDADFSADPNDCNDRDAFCAWMPSMGHGTSPEENPTHEAHGVYKGKTTFSMPGKWQLTFNPVIDGEVVPFDVMVQVSS